jgi:hypothetical protein
MNILKGIPRLTTIIKSLAIVLPDKDRKSLPRIAREFLDLSIRTRSVATYYFTTLLHKKVITNCRDYLSTREMRRSQEVLSDLCAVEILGNKLFAREYFVRSGLPQARLLAFNFGPELFILEGGAQNRTEMTSPEAAAGLLAKVAANSPSEMIFIKPINGTQGQRARKIPARKERWDATFLGDLLAYLLSGNFLFQETISQHPALDRLNASSLNSIRIDTYRGESGPPEVISAYLRIGLAGSPVDNVGSGGVFVGIDLDSGTLKEFGFKQLLSGGAVHTEHPDSHVVFKGYPLPHFDQVKRVAVEAAGWLPPALVGWDVGITANGVALLEGNSVYYGMEHSDTAYGGYRNNPVFRKALEAYRRKTA